MSSEDRVDVDRLCPGCLHTYTVTGGEFDPDWTLHPGTTWSEIIEHSQASIDEVAETLGITRSQLVGILNGRGGRDLPSPELTVRFARWAGVQPRFMWQLVANYQLDLALGKVEA